MIRRLKVLVGIAFALAFGIYQVHSVLAYATTSYPNFAGVTTAVALKDVWVVDSNSWNAKVQSYTTNPVRNIGTIGWTWWTFRDTCNGVIIDNWVQPGSVRYGANNHWDVGVDDRDFCSGSYRGWSMGVHDFKEGSSIWRPYLETNEGI